MTDDGGNRRYALLTPRQRQRTHEAHDDLLEGAQKGIAGGFDPNHDRHEILYSNARKLGVYVWPALADRIVRQALRTTPRP